MSWAKISYRLELMNCCLIGVIFREFKENNITAIAKSGERTLKQATTLRQVRADMLLLLFKNNFLVASPEVQFLARSAISLSLSLILCCLSISIGSDFMLINNIIRIRKAVSCVVRKSVSVRSPFFV